MLIKYFYLFYCCACEAKIQFIKKKRYDYYWDCFKNRYKSIKSRIVFGVVASHHITY